MWAEPAGKGLMEYVNVELERGHCKATSWANLRGRTALTGVASDRTRGRGARGWIDEVAPSMVKLIHLSIYRLNIS